MNDSQNTILATGNDATMKELASNLASQIVEAFENKKPLSIEGGGSKGFYGNHIRGLETSTINIKPYTGVMIYEPSELVIRARAGTPLSEIVKLLDANGQKLPFEPPFFSEYTTIGGTVAAGLSGPERAYASSVRDAVLGVKIINGKGEILNFGGEMMKNVAGYDVSRLIAGSLGILGVILEVSIKVVPKPLHTETFILKQDRVAALNTMRDLAKQSIPVSATAWVDEQFYVRVMGNNQKVIEDAHKRISGEPLIQANDFWESVRDQSHEFFKNKLSLWRLSTPANSELPFTDEEQFIEWGGALRWINSNVAPSSIREAARNAGGHATLFRNRYEDKRDIPAFEPLDPVVMRLHQQLKKSFDPAGILNPGRLFREL